MRQYKPITVTIHSELLARFKDHCQNTKQPLSQFLAQSALEAIQRKTKTANDENAGVGV